MFNSELYKISEKALKSLNEEDIKNRNLQMETEVAEIIKNYSYAINKNGIAKIRVFSKNYKNENPDYKVLRSIIDSGRQKYFEEEYSLYFVGDESIEAQDTYNMITFIWNSIEYNLKNNPQVKRKLKK